MNFWRLPICLFLACFAAELCIAAGFEVFAPLSVRGTSAAYIDGIALGLIVVFAYLSFTPKLNAADLSERRRDRFINALILFVVVLCFESNLNLLLHAVETRGWLVNACVDAVALSLVAGISATWLSFVERRAQNAGETTIGRSLAGPLIAGVLFAALCITAVPMFFAVNNAINISKSANESEMLSLASRQRTFAEQIGRGAFIRGGASRANLEATIAAAKSQATQLSERVHQYAVEHDLTDAQRSVIPGNALYRQLQAQYWARAEALARAQSGIAQSELQAAIDAFLPELESSIAVIETLEHVQDTEQSAARSLQWVIGPMLLIGLELGLMWPLLRLVIAQQANLAEKARLVRITRNPIVRSDKNRRLIWANDAFCNMLGYSLDELIGRPTRELYGCDDADKAVMEGIAETLAKGVAAKGTIRVAAKSGQCYWVDLDVNPIMDGRGKIESIFSIFTDVTALVNARHREEGALLDLRAQHWRLNTVADLAGVGAWEVDLTTNELTWSEQIRRICEVDENYVPNFTDSTNHYHEDVQDRLVSTVNHCIVSGESWDMELPFRTATGREIWVRSVGRPIQINGKSARLVGAIQDISERIERANEIKRAHEKLEESNRELKQEREMLEQRVQDRTAALESEMRKAEGASRAKSQFLAGMSHELRTPLNAVIGYSEIMREAAEDEGRKGDLDDLDCVLAASHHLLGLINNILNISKIEAEKMEIDAEEFELAVALSQALDTVRPQAAARNIPLILSVAPEVGRCFSDALKLKQCFINLLSNAVKFTEAGSVEIRAFRDSGKKIIVEVQDSGIGIAPEKLDAIFEPFMQEDASTTRRFGGTGLGLTITRRMARLLGGDVTVTSAVGVGSTFRLEFKAEADPSSNIEGAEVGYAAA